MASTDITTMSQPAKLITMNVFSTKTLYGSRQSILLVNAKCLITEPIQTTQPGIDYTIAYFDGKNKANVVWRNHQTMIRFCGSAAYAISYYLLHKYQIPNLTIQSPHVTLHADYDLDVSLYIPSDTMLPAKVQPFDEGCLFFQPISNVYFLETNDLDAFHQLNWTKDELYGLPLHNPHGFSCFYWHDETKTGYVRYFTPWHGREEDSVTGSIQACLTPYVAKTYGCTNQTWIQRSFNGGQLSSSWMGDKVRLQGNCEIQ